MKTVCVWESAWDEVVNRLDGAARGVALSREGAADLAERMKRAWWRPGRAVPPERLSLPVPTRAPAPIQG